MRNTKLFLIITALTFATSSTYANEAPSETSVSSEIQQLIQNSSIQWEASQKLLVNFIINSENEIIVVSTNNKNQESAIRYALNLKKVNATDLEQNTLYTLPIQIQKR